MARIASAKRLKQALKRRGVDQDSAQEICISSRSINGTKQRRLIVDRLRAILGRFYVLDLEGEAIIAEACGEVSQPAAAEPAGESEVSAGEED